MQIFRSLAGYTFGHADIVRRAMAKKKADVMENERSTFVDGCMERGIDEKTATEIFDEMADFAKYAFNKSHACAYSYLTYRTAYLKYHYPAEYMASLITSTLDAEEKVNFYIAECKSLGIKVLPPDINESGYGFDISGKAIRFGLLAIKNVGTNFVKDILEEREIRKFRSLEDFIMRMSKKMLNRKMIESLIFAGAMDSFGISRSKMAAALDDAITTMNDINRRNVTGQMDFFSTEGGGETTLKIKYPDQRDDTLSERLEMEKEVTGVYISGHPLDAYTKERRHSALVSDITESMEASTGDYAEGQVVDVLGMVSSKKIKETKKGDVMAFVTFQDVSSVAEIVVFPKIFDVTTHLLEPEAVLVARCEITMKDDEVKLIARSFVRAVPDGEYKETQAIPEPSEEIKKEAPQRKNDGERKIYLRLKTRNEALVKRICALISIFEGTTPVVLYFEDEGKYVKLTHGIELNTDTAGDLKRLVGEDNTVIK